MKRLLLAFVLLVFSSFAIAAININTASKEELDALPGVGPVKAQAIVDYRKANGPFKTIDDLKKVNGIGDATFEKLKSGISVSGEFIGGQGCAGARCGRNCQGPGGACPDHQPPRRRHRHLQQRRPRPSPQGGGAAPATATTAKAKETAPKK